MNGSRCQPDPLAQLQHLSERETLARQCLLRLRAIGQRARQIDRECPQSWNAIVAERQEVIDRLGSLGWPPSGAEAAVIAAGAGSHNTRVRGAAAQARAAADGNLTLLAEIVSLDADIQRQLAQQVAGLAEAVARPARRVRVRAAYGLREDSQPRFLDRRK